MAESDDTAVDEPDQDNFGFWDFGLLEGQMRIAFRREALAENHIRSARILLLDCDDITRAERLKVQWRQPDLANADVMNWVRYLREETLAAQIRVLDTGRLSVAECVDVIVAPLLDGRPVSSWVS